MEKSFAGIQGFFRSHRFSQRNFFSDNGISLIVSAVKNAGSIREKSSCEPWESVLTEGYEATSVDLRKAYDAVVVKRKEARDTSERWFGVRSVESSEVGSHLVGLECGYPKLLRLDRLNTCLGLCLLGVSLVVVQHYLFEALGKESAREVRHLLPLLAPNDCSNLTTSQLLCQKEEGCILKIPTLNAL